MKFKLGDVARIRGRRDVGAGRVVGMRRNGGILLQWRTGAFPIQRWCDPEELEQVGIASRREVGIMTPERYL